MKCLSKRNAHRDPALSYIRDNAPVSRGDLANRFGLDKKTISRLVDELLAEGSIESAGRRESASGRPQELLRLRGAHANFIGIDLGATHITGVLVDLNLSVLDRQYFAIRPGLSVEVILEQMRSIGASLLSSARATAPVGAVGICVPGFVDPRTGVSVLAENIPGWRDVALRERFSAAFGRTIVVDDSSRAWVRAELRIGVNRNRRDALLIDLGYGIGMGIVASGNVHAGSAWRAGEIGHTVVQPGGPPCRCGSRGCLEAVASGRAIGEQAREGIMAGRSPLLRDLVHGEAASVTAQDVAVAARMGDAFAADLLRGAGAVIGIALGNAVNILNPSLVILAGALVADDGILRGRIVEAMRGAAMPGLLDGVDVIASALGVDGSALGAATLAADTAFSGA